MGLPQIITIIQDYIGNLCIESPGFGGSPHFSPYESPCYTNPLPGAALHARL